MSVKLSDLCSLLSQLLQPDRFRDYSPNGLQVEGRADISKIVTGVTASEAMIDAAIKAKADALLVHHGYFWRGEDSCITGMKKRRLKKLLSHDISLLAYHLPLDAHQTLGNNYQLAALLDWEVIGGLNGESDISMGLRGILSEPLSLQDMGKKISRTLHREPQLISGGNHPVKTLGWCTGAAQDYIEKAVTLKLDAFISGEVSERTVHVARECGIHYIAAGHHATERYGVQALGSYLSDKMALTHEFIDIDNPV